jgi:hypothetical protein
MRRLLPLAAGVAGSALAAAVLPRLASEGLRGCLVVAPSVAGVVAAVSAQLGVRGLRAAWPLDERWAALGWLALVAGLERLGLPALDVCAALSLFALLGLRLFRLAPWLARRLRRKTGAWWLPFAALPFAAYLVALPWAGAAHPPNGDEPYYLLLTESLASDFDVDLADEYRSEAWRTFATQVVAPQPGDPRGPHGEIYSRHEPLLPLLLVPFWIVGGLDGVRLAMLLTTAALAATTLAAALALGATRRGALRAWALAAFSPPLLLYSYQVWIEVPAALMVAIALVGLARMRRAETRKPARWSAFGFALPLVLLPLLKLRFLAVAAPLALAGVLAPGARRGTRRAVAALVLVAGAVLLAVNAAIWGNPLRMHSAAELTLLDLPLARFLRGGVGLFFDVAFGLFAAAPLWLVIVPGTVRMVGRVRRSALPALVLAAFLPYLVLVASRHEWYGGWSPPFRYGLVALPLLAAAVAWAFERPLGGFGRAFAALLAAATVLRAAVVLAVPGWSFSVADGRASWLDVATARFGADVARLLPSAVRPRPATWIVPALAVALALLVLRRRPPARRGTAAHLGVAFLILGGVGLLVTAHRLPTRVAQIEDPWVRKTGGEIWPGRWTMDRTRFPGGWLLPAGAQASFRPVAGGRRVAIRVRWMPVGSGRQPVVLELAAGETPLRRITTSARDSWRVSPLAEVDWRPGTPLVLRVGSARAGGPVGVVVDRVELAWE